MVPYVFPSGAIFLNKPTLQRFNMRRAIGFFLATFFLATAALAQETPARSAASDGPTTRPAPQGEAVETVVFLRHGEKPPGGLGQISPQGLNRALALSEVLPKMYGKP